MGACSCPKTHELFFSSSFLTIPFFSIPRYFPSKAWRKSIHSWIRNRFIARVLLRASWYFSGNVFTRPPILRSFESGYQAFSWAWLELSVLTKPQPEPTWLKIRCPATSFFFLVMFIAIYSVYTGSLICINALEWRPRVAILSSKSMEIISPIRQTLPTGMQTSWNA